MSPKTPVFQGSLALFCSLRQVLPIFMRLPVTPCSPLVFSGHDRITAQALEAQDCAKRGWRFSRKINGRLDEPGVDVAQCRES